MLLQPIASCCTHGRRALTDSAAAPSGRLMCKVDSCCVHSPPDVAYRHLLQPEKDADGFFLNGRATWFEHPHTGSCGYGKRCRPPWRACLREGRCVSISCLPLCHPLPPRIPSPPPCTPCAAGKLEGYSSFGRDAVAAMPDVAADYAGSCGRCYEIKCRGIQARRWVGLRRAGSCPLQWAAAGCGSTLLLMQYVALPFNTKHARLPACPAVPTALLTWTALTPATTPQPGLWSRLSTPAPARAMRCTGAGSTGGQADGMGQPASRPTLKPLSQSIAYPTVLPPPAEVVLR